MIRCEGGNRAEFFPEVGEKVTVDIALPANPAIERRCLHGQATVVRVDGEGRDLRVAVRFEHLQFGLWPESGRLAPEFAEAIERVVM